MKNPIKIIGLLAITSIFSFGFSGEAFGNHTEDISRLATRIARMASTSKATLRDLQEVKLTLRRAELLLDSAPAPKGKFFAIQTNVLKRYEGCDPTKEYGRFLCQISANSFCKDKNKHRRPYGFGVLQGTDPNTSGVYCSR